MRRRSTSSSWCVSTSIAVKAIGPFVRGADPKSQDVYLAAAIYIVGGSFAKISLVIFYFRLSPQRWFRLATWASLLFIAGYTIGIFFALIFACTPIAMSFDITNQAGTCINRPSLYIATAVVNIMSDIVLFCLPLPIVVKLQVPRRQKLGLLLIFLLGSM